jgi:hypothetical protein
MADEVVGWVDRRYPPCSLGLFTSLTQAQTFLEREDKTAFLQELAEQGELIANPVPDSLLLPSLAAAQ